MSMNARAELNRPMRGGKCGLRRAAEGPGCVREWGGDGFVPAFRQPTAFCGDEPFPPLLAYFFFNVGSQAQRLHRLYSANLPPAVDFFELHFELLHQRVAAAVKVGE